MKNIILCEGVTDAILISLYLERTCQWIHKREIKKSEGLVRLPIRNAETEAANWYDRAGNHLAIWGVGSKDNFAYAVEEIMKINHRVENEARFGKVVIVADRDRAESDEEKEQELGAHFARAGMSLPVKNKEWVATVYKDGFGEESSLEVLALILPFDKQGALETFLLDALAEHEDEKAIVDACRAFVAATQSEKYLRTDRQKLKVEFATSLAVMHPGRTFWPMKEMLSGIPWENYRTIQAGFQLLEQL